MTLFVNEILQYIRGRDSNRLSDLIQSVEQSSYDNKNQLLGILGKHERDLNKPDKTERTLINLCYYVVNEIDTELSEDALILEEAADLAKEGGYLKQFVITTRELVRIWSLLGNQNKAANYLNTTIQAELSLKGRKPPIGRCSKYRKSDNRCVKYLDLGIICPYLGRLSLCKISPKTRKKSVRHSGKRTDLVIIAEVALGVGVNLISAVYFQLTLNLGNFLLLNVPLAILLIVFYTVVNRKLR